MPDRYTYRDSEVLKNKFGVTDSGLAREIELRISYQRIAELPEFIRQTASSIFDDLRHERCLRGLPQDQFAERLAYHWGEVTALHPFRDGNTRSQRVFFDQLAREAGWSIDWSHINKNMRAFVDARTYAITHDPGRLRDILAPVIHPLSQDA